MAYRYAIEVLRPVQPISFCLKKCLPDLPAFGLDLTSDQGVSQFESLRYPVLFDELIKGYFFSFMRVHARQE
ncbi:MAG: hypothetical protein C0434_03340 [Xanthomonadaceae bacterium]|nr:hypothetical protein [Xanthomonadaceae bacterium]